MYILQLFCLEMQLLDHKSVCKYNIDFVLLHAHDCVDITIRKVIFAVSDQTVVRCWPEKVF